MWYVTGMPTENDTPNEPSAEDLLQLRDDEIRRCHEEISSLTKENDALAQDLDSLRDELKKAKAAPRAAAPSGDYCVLKGKTYEVLGTVTTRFASEEGRKNNTEDQELVIIKH